jgi:methionyl aminopeptidase
MPGGIEIKTRDEIAYMREAALIVYEVLEELSKAVAPGVTLEELDDIAERETLRRGAVCAFKGLYGFPKNVCISVNEQVVHGIPTRRKLVEGDLVKLDYGVTKRGFYGDSARTVAVGKVSPEAARLLEETRQALEKGIAAMVTGGRISDIGSAIEAHVAPFGYGIVRDYVGHGIGKRLHEEPQVPNYGPSLWSRGQPNPRMRPGMVLAIEPMITEGDWNIRPGSDGWAIYTADGSLAAHCEHTVAITDNGPRVLTRRSGSQSDGE